MKKTLTLLFILALGISHAQHQNVSLLYHWEDSTLVGSSTYDNVYNEVWGFTNNGYEFAVIGSTFGTHIFDITNISNVTEVARIPGKAQGGIIIHRDYHDYKGYLFAVADEGASSLQVIDISQLPASYSVVYDSDSLFKRAHNIFIDSSTGKMYANGVATASAYVGFQCYDVSDPLNPQFVSSYHNAGFTHDTYAQNDTVFINAGNNGLYILDYNDAQNPQVLGTLKTYPYKGYNHSGWPTANLDYYFMADENAGHKMKSVDVRDFSNMQVLTTFFSDVDSNYSMPHNQIWHEDYLFVSHYHDGLQIWDVSNPANPVRTGYYKTYPGMDHQVYYKGAWGVYPFLPSGKILVSDMQYGLFVLDGTQALSRQELAINEFELYPNPSAGNFNVVLPENWHQANYQVYSLDGRLIKQGILSAQANEINVDAKNGIYLVEISNEKQRLVQKLVLHN